jgi:hypothetical protein
MKTIGFLQKYFKGHLYRMYIVNACKSITFPWYVVKGILAEQTTLKIQIYGNNSPQ